ncbi:MAG: precorrin-2 C(20)-methyltransferase [bacterium]
MPKKPKMIEKDLTEHNLFIIGAGPGDPELITVKAVNALIKSDFIFYPDVYGGKNKIAYDIIKNAAKFAGVQDFAEERLIPLEVEMKRSSGRNGDLYKENALKIIEKLKEGDCAYVTLGDPMFYSTYWGLHNAIQNAVKQDKSVKEGCGFNIKIINGVSSFHYSFGLIGEPYIIKNGSVLITVPVKKELPEIEREIRFIAGKFPKPQAIVFMKAGAYIKDILNAFKEICPGDLEENRLKLYLIEKSKIIDNFSEREDLNFDYFSILIGVFV